MKAFTDAPLFLLSSVLCGLLACTSSPEAPAEPGTDDSDHQEGVVQLSPEAASRAGIRLAEVEERMLAGLLETTGSVDFNQDTLAHVSPRVPGRVESAHGRLGAQVRAGEVLARIDSIELGKARAEYLQAKAQAELARENYERERGLFADRISSEQEMLATRASDRQAQVALQTAEETLHLYGMSNEQVRGLHYDDPQASIYSVRAPFPGKVVEKHATLGELVTPETRLFLLADLRRVWIWIDVYERDLAAVHLGDGVRVRVEAYADEVFRGQVSYLSDRVDSSTRTVRARLDVDNPGEKLRAGMFAQIELTDPHAADGEAPSLKSLVVPEGAVQQDGGTFIAFVPIGENRYQKRVLRVGRRSGGFVEVLDGITARERIVVEGAFVLKSEASKEQLGEEGH